MAVLRELPGVNKPETDLAVLEASLEKEHFLLLLRACELLTSSLEMQLVLDSLMDQVIEVIGAERGFVMTRDDESAPWQFRSARAMEPSGIDADEFRISRGVVDRVARDGVSIFTSDAIADERLSDRESVALFHLKSILCVPLCVQGRILGVIYADHRMQTGVFTRREKVLLEFIARVAAIAVENAMLYAKLQRLHEASMEQARRELADTQAQLMHSSKLAAVGELAAGVAHEINNPLGAVALNISALRRAVCADVDRQRLDIVEKAVDRCRGIVDRLLRFSRAVPDCVEPVDVGEVIHDVIALVAHEFRKEDVQIDVSVAESLVVSGNAGELSQVIMNLLLNARDAVRLVSPDEVRHVAIDARRADRHVVVEIRDNGSGIDRAVAHRIFEPFFTTKEVGDGIGLGLAVSFQIVSRHGGTLDVVSEPGQGATFFLRLPSREQA